MSIYGKKKYVVVCVIVIVLPFVSISNFPSNSQGVKDKSALVNPYVTEFVSDFEQYAEQLLHKTKTPGAAIAIVKDSSILYSNGIGIKTFGAEDSVDGHTIFRIASLSKGFASVMAGVLVEDSLFNWNDRVIDYMPDFALKSEESTNLLQINHLLSHTTGLPRHSYTNLIEEGDSLPDMINHLREVDLISGPGEIYSYQNVAFSIIGAIIHNRCNKPYSEILQDKIFNPLEMDDASLTYNKIMADSNVASPHGYGRHSWVPMEISDKYYNAAPAGGINASAKDMARWLTLLLGNHSDIVHTETLHQLYKPAVETPVKYRYFRHWDDLQKAYYGLGWRVVVTENDTLIHHGGYVNGYRNEMAFSLKEKIGICVLSNAPTSFAAKSVPKFFDSYHQYADSIDQWHDLIF